MLSRRRKRSWWRDRAARLGARQCRLGLLLGWRHRLFVRPRQRLAVRARLSASRGDLPAGHWGKLLAAWQGTLRGRLVRRWCARRVLKRAWQRRLGLLLGWTHRLFARPRQWLAICAGQGVAGRVLKGTRLPRLRLLLGWGPRRDLTGLVFRRSWASYHCRLLGHGGRQRDFRGDRCRRHASSDTCRRRQTRRGGRVR